LWPFRPLRGRRNVLRHNDQRPAGISQDLDALAPSIHKAELERARRKPPDNLDAYDYVLRALPHMFANTPAEARLAIPLVQEALRLDPDYAYAHALLSGVAAQIFRSATGQERAERLERDHTGHPA
jgi:hypothetical protein